MKRTHFTIGRFFLVVLVSLFASGWPHLFGAPAARAAESAGRPNIVFIFSDDHGYQAISAYDKSLVETPNIDRIAQEGMRFDRCYVTNSLCGPSRAVVQTGKYSHINGFYKNGDKFDGSQPTMPKMLQAAGYQTAIVGKWHLVSDPTGFNYWNVLPGQGQYYNPVLIDNGKRVKHMGYATDIITDLTLDWLKQKRDPDKPFLLMYQNKAPHRNWMPPIRHLTLFDDRTMPEPTTYFDDYSHRASPARNQQMEIARDLDPRPICGCRLPPRKRARIRNPGGIRRCSD